MADTAVTSADDVTAPRTGGVIIKRDNNEGGENGNGQVGADLKSMVTKTLEKESVASTPPPDISAVPHGSDSEISGGSDEESVRPLEPSDFGRAVAKLTSVTAPPAVDTQTSSSEGGVVERDEAQDSGVSCSAADDDTTSQTLDGSETGSCRGRDETAGGRGEVKTDATAEAENVVSSISPPPPTSDPEDAKLRCSADIRNNFPDPTVKSPREYPSVAAASGSATSLPVDHMASDVRRSSPGGARRITDDRKLDSFLNKQAAAFLGGDSEEAAEAPEGMTVTSQRKPYTLNELQALARVPPQPSHQDFPPQPPQDLALEPEAPENEYDYRVSHHRVSHQVGQRLAQGSPLKGLAPGTAKLQAEITGLSLEEVVEEGEQPVVGAVFSDLTSPTVALPSVMDGLSSGEVSEESGAEDEVHVSSIPSRAAAPPSSAPILPEPAVPPFSPTSVTSDPPDVTSRPTVSGSGHVTTPGAAGGGEGVTSSEEEDVDAAVARARREALHSALQDIQHAIARSRRPPLSNLGVEVPAPVPSPDNSTVWVPRNTYAEVQSPREQLRQQRESQARQTQQADNSARAAEGVATAVDRPARPADYLSASEDSDDSYDDHVDGIGGFRLRSRRHRGSRYASLPLQDDDSSSGHARTRRDEPPLDTFSSHQRLQGLEGDLGQQGGFGSGPGESSDLGNGQAQPRSPSLNNLHHVGDFEEVDEEEEEEEEERRAVRPEHDYDTDEETDKLLQKQYTRQDHHTMPDVASQAREVAQERQRQKAKKVTISDPGDDSVLIEGVLFRCRYLGSTQLMSEGRPSKAMRMLQAQEAVGRIKAPDGENQPSTAVDLFVSTEKIMVLNTNLQEIMMDHSLRSISFIADIGELLVIMARRRPTSPADSAPSRHTKILCHVFESDEAQLIAQSIGEAFQVAYVEFLKANGIEDPGLMKEVDYQEVLNQQEISGDELSLFADKGKQKNVLVQKTKGEPLGMVVVESGWGSMVPTVVLANMNPAGPAARCGQLNIGDQLLSVSGMSLVGLPLSSAQQYIKSVKNQTVVKVSLVQCPPVVEVLIKRPDIKYQLGFSVQNGVICSLLRGGIAERGGIRVGHRIIEIGGTSVVAVSHERIVSMLANSVGEIRMKTMPTSIFRLLTGQETPNYI